MYPNIPAPGTPGRPRGRPRAITKAQYEEYVARLRAGETIYRLKLTTGHSSGTFHKIAKEEGIEIPDWRKQRGMLMAEGAKSYFKAERIKLGDRLFAICEQMLDQMEEDIAQDGACDTKALHQLTQVFSILTEKRRLEDGESTSRDENVLMATAKDSLNSRLEELKTRYEEVQKYVPNGPTAVPPSAPIEQVEGTIEPPTQQVRSA